MSSGSDALDEADDQLTVDGLSEDVDLKSIFETDAFEKSVVGILVGWIVKNVFLDPAAFTLGGLAWVANMLFNSMDATLRTALGSAGAGVYDAILGPTGAVTAVQEALMGMAASAGAGSALAAGLANLLILAVIAGTAYLLARVILGYLSGGVLS